MSKHETSVIPQSPIPEVNLGRQLWDGQPAQAKPIPPRKPGHGIEPIDDIENPWSQDLPPEGINIANFFGRILGR